MPFNIDSAFGIHPQAVAARARRAEILAANIANADTPNYKARDIDVRALLGGAQDKQVTARLVATNAAHLPDTQAAGDVGGALMSACRCSRRSTATPWIRRRSMRSSPRTHCSTSRVSPSWAIPSKPF